MTDITKQVPSLDRILYDELFTADTRFGLGEEQIFVDPDLAKSTILAILQDPNRDFVGIDIDQFIADLDLDTIEGIVETMNLIYDNFQAEDVNFIFFEILKDAFVNKREFEDIFKTSWVALQITENIGRPQPDPVEFTSVSPGGVCPDEEPSPTPSHTPTPTPTPVDISPTPTPTITPTVTETPAITPDPTPTPTLTPTLTPSPTEMAAPLVSGYTAGGYGPPSGFRTIDEFPFASPFTTAIQVGLLTETFIGGGIFRTAGASSDNDGYAIAGGISVPGFEAIERVQSFPFSSPFTTATIVGNLSQTTSWLSGQYNQTDGYASGGMDNTYVVLDKIDTFPFASPFTTATVVGDMSIGGRYVSGQSSDEDGFVSGGMDGSYALFSKIDTFPFASPFITATVIGNLTTNKDKTIGNSSVTHGYASSGGYYGIQIEQFPFSSPFTTATIVGNLSTNRLRGTGYSGSQDGFASGGNYGGNSSIDSFPFSTPFVTATVVGNLSQARQSAAGSQG